mmetsp:Transcript_3027/g.5113  ORF Transcript_3027/g.5113 Transcript_3027/m.5113 type:complete len:91 (+) Transcript_3027:354-626(+)
MSGSFVQSGFPPNAQTAGQQISGGSQGQHNKHISMNGLPYEKVKGLTPMANKNQGSKGGNIHLQGQGLPNQMGPSQATNDDTDGVGSNGR